jgi:hypothetical protein
MSRTMTHFFAAFRFITFRCKFPSDSSTAEWMMFIVIKYGGYFLQWCPNTLSKKRNAYSISHGFIFKVNKKTYYVKSIKIKNSYQQSLSHKFWNWTHVWESEVLRYVRMVPQNDNSMITIQKNNNKTQQTNTTKQRPKLNKTKYKNNKQQMYIFNNNSDYVLYIIYCHLFFFFCVVCPSLNYVFWWPPLISSDFSCVLFRCVSFRFAVFRFCFVSHFTGTLSGITFIRYVQNRKI